VSRIHPDDVLRFKRLLNRREPPSRRWIEHRIVLPYGKTRWVITARADSLGRAWKRLEIILR